MNPTLSSEPERPYGHSNSWVPTTPNCSRRSIAKRLAGSHTPSMWRAITQWTTIDPSMSVENRQSHRPLDKQRAADAPPRTRQFSHYKTL